MRLYCKLRVLGVYMHPKRAHMYANDPTVYVKSLQNVEVGHYTGTEEDLMFTHVKSMKIMLGTTF